MPDSVEIYIYSYIIFDKSVEQLKYQSNHTAINYQYDVENQLTDVKIKTNGTATSEQHNKYNGKGQRISKIDIKIAENTTQSSTTNYYYKRNTLLYTTDGNGNKIY